MVRRWILATEAEDESSSSEESDEELEEPVQGEAEQSNEEVYSHSDAPCF
jgi:hypothetical protein